MSVTSFSGSSSTFFHLFSSKGGAKIVTHHLPFNFYTLLLLECKLALGRREWYYPTFTAKA